jgi:hypothetical protein
LCIWLFFTRFSALSGNNLFLAPGSQTALHLSGRITPKSGSELDTIGELFTNYLQVKNQTLSVAGSFVQPSGSSGPVSWLSTAFKTLVLEVTLPGQKFDVRKFPFFVLAVN